MADTGLNIYWHRPVVLMTQVGDVANTVQYFCWHRPVIWLCCGWRRPVFLVTQASDMAELWPTYVTVVANAGQYFYWHRLVMWLMQAWIFADTGQWYCWSCGQHRPVFLMSQVSDVTDTGQNFCWHRPVIWLNCGQCMSLLWLMQASIFNDTG